MISMDIPIKNIRVTDWNPRQDFNQDDLNELKASIEEYGILEPLIVRPKTKKTYELVAGERRFRAAGELKLKTVPVVVKDLTDSQVHEVMLIENLQRSQLQPLEEAQSLEVLLQEDITQEQLAKKLGKSQSWVANRLRLLQAPDKLKELLISREITPKHVMVALPFVEYAVYDEIMKRLDNCDGSISVSEFEAMIQAVITPYSSKFVFRLDNMSWDYEQLGVDVSECANCADIVSYEIYGETVRYCLNKTCWKDMVKKARDAKDQADEATLDDNVVDISKLDSDSWNWLPQDNPDENECSVCDSYKSTTGGGKICMTPVCSDEKRIRHKAECDMARALEEKCIDDAVTKWTAGKVALLGDDLRKVMLMFFDSMYGNAIEKAFKPWYTSDDFDDDDAILSVPDDELVIAVTRLIVYEGISGNARENLVEMFPGAAKFLDQKALDDYVIPEVPA